MARVLDSTSSGSRYGTVVRTLAFHPCGPGSIPGPGVMWVEFVVGFRLALSVFHQVLRFSSLHKNEHFQIPI